MGRHIQAVFDAYDEPYDAMNWQRLQRKRHGRVVMFYLKRAGAAAAVALLLTAGVLLWNQQVGDESSLAGQGPVPVEQPDPVSLTPEENMQVEPASGEALEEAVSREVQEEPAFGESLAEADLRENSDKTNGSGNISPPRAFSAGKGQSDRNVAAALKMKLPSAAAGSPAALFPEGFVIRGPVAAVSQTAPVPGGEKNAADPAGENPASPLSGENSLPEPALANLDAKRERESTGSRFSVGFVTTSLMNYANGNTANDVHFGAGITSGLKLSDKFSLHSGFVLAENSLSLNNSNSSVQSSAYAMDAAPSNQLSSVSKNNIVQKVSPNSMDVNLLIVDIPLNLTYRINAGRSDILVTGGLSSFAYLDQEYSYHNTVQLYTDATVEAPEPVVRNEKAFSHFDLAKQLNLAIGTEVPLGKGSVLIVEPYVKYPLGELTSEQIRFGSAGMNLRLSFGTK